MVNANENKWEPVNYGDLRRGDDVRLTHGGGTVLYGRVLDGAIEVLATRTTSDLSWWRALGFSVERAARERTLPTEPGWYVRQSDDSSIYRLFVDAGHNWYSNDNITVSWTAIHKSDVPDDLVRLVPVAEVEAAEKRNHEAWHALEDYRRIGGQSFHRIITDIQNILGGKSKP